MKLIMCTMYDNLTNSHSDIKLCVNDAHAKREYHDIFNNIRDKAMINDITVKVIGTFDTENGNIDSDIRTLASAKELISNEEK